MDILPRTLGSFLARRAAQRLDVTTRVHATAILDTVTARHYETGRPGERGGGR